MIKIVLAREKKRPVGMPIKNGFGPRIKKALRLECLIKNGFGLFIYLAAAYNADKVLPL